MSQQSDERQQGIGAILLVEADTGRRAAYAEALVAVGHRVEVAHTGEEGLARVGRVAFDVLLSDWELPGLDGPGLLRSVRARDPDLPVVLVVGPPRAEAAVRALNAGAFQYLPLPLDPGRIEEAVADAMRRHGGVLTRRAGEQAQWLPAACGSDWLEARFEAALGTMTMAYQPIVSCIERRSVAFEALVRGGDPVLERPERLFDCAGRLGRLLELGRGIRRKVAADMAALPLEATMFVNLHPGDLYDDDLFASDAPLSRVARRVVLEVSERASIHDQEGLVARVAALRRLGYRIAIDDLGAGYASLAAVAALEPDVVKIDQAIIRGVEERPVSRQMVRALTALSHELEMVVVAEGVETALERETLMALDCDLLQGFLFARPDRRFLDPRL